MVINNKVQFIYENKLIELENPDPNQTILSFIRDRLKKTGTKEGCAEGGCGACTVVLGDIKNNEINYKAVNSCITLLPTLQGKQLILVEDLISKEGVLHPVQQAMVNYHGSQCWRYERAKVHNTGNLSSGMQKLPSRCQIIMSL